MRPFIPKGWTKKLLIVGEAPGEDEDERTHIPFTGDSGRLLHRLLRRAGYAPDDVAFTNANRCRPPHNLTPSMSQVRDCRPFLLRTLQALAPRYVIGMGRNALRALLNRGSDLAIANYRGRLLEVPGIDGALPEKPKVWITYHPAAVVRGAVELEERILEDLRRKWTEFHPHPPSALPSVKKGVLSVDTEYGADRTLLNVGLADSESALGIDVQEEREWKSITQSRLNRATYIAGHSIFGDILKLKENGVGLKSSWITGENVLCSLLTSRMRDETLPSYELENLLLSRYPTQPWKLASSLVLKKTHDMSCVPSTVRSERTRLDAWAVLPILRENKSLLRTPLSRFTHRIAATLSRIELVGAVIDLREFEGLGQKYGEELLDLEAQLRVVATNAGLTEFSPTNDGHVRALLYDKFKLKPPGYTKKRREPSVTKLALNSLNHPIAELLIKYSAYDKLFRTNYLGVRPLIVSVTDLLGYLPFNFNPLGTETGRRSSHDPNSQNWPRSIRRIVCSRYLGGQIGAFDYSSLEMRIMAWLAKDDKLMYYFTKGGGYIGIAKELLGFEPKKDTPAYVAVKSLVLGTDYNMQEWKFAKTLWDGVKTSPTTWQEIRLSPTWREHLKQAARLRRSYLDRFPGLKRYMEAREEELLTGGAVASATGRIRHLPCRAGRETPGYPHLLNQAINFPVQSLASDVTGSALIDVERELLSYYLMSYDEYLTLLLETQKKYLTSQGKGDILPTYSPATVCFNEVHDNLVFDVHPSRVKDHDLIRETMQAAPSLKKLLPGFDIPLSVNAKISDRWE